MKRALTLTLILSAAIFAPACGYAEVSPNDIFSKASDFYEKGRYDDAISEYHKMLAVSIESGNLYYNLGNCYFKKSEIGRAILNYERAKRLIPRDKDLKSNYEYARYKSEAGPVTVPKRWFFRAMDKIFAGFTVNELAVFLSCLYLSAVFLILAAMFFAPVRGYVVSLLIVLVMLGSLGVFELKIRIAGIGTDSVVITKVADAKFAPFDSATTFFQLNEGDKVRVMQPKDDWQKVKRADGKIGWVKSSAIERI